MPLDALHYNFIATELDDTLRDGKIEKITMPSSDTIALVIRARGKNNSLLLSANPSLARCHITSNAPPSLPTAPSFLMHLRKNIANGKIIGVSCVADERIININILAKTELGDEVKKTIVAEIMGKHSNIILLNDSGIITECIKHISLDVSSKRQLLPSLRYTLAPPQDKVSPTNPQELKRVLGAFTGENLHKYILSSVLALAPATVTEIIYNVFKGDIPSSLSQKNIDDLIKSLTALYDANTTCPCVTTDGKFILESFVRPYNSKANQIEKCDSLNQAVDKYFLSSTTKAKFTDRYRLLQSAVNYANTKLEKKLGTLKQSRLDALDYDQDKINGEILTANIFKVKYGDKILVADNYYTDPPSEITIKLDPKKSPSTNAQKYYKLYNKKKATILNCDKQIETITKDLEYFSTISDSLELAENLLDLDDILAELLSTPLLNSRLSSSKTNPKNKKEIKTTSGTKKSEYMGYTIYTGKNNVQNDTLVKNSAPNDVWLHTKNIHGSHTVIANPKKTIPPDNVLKYAGSLTAHYSKASDSENVPVDYTFIKFVSKPKGAPLGKVIYTNQKTIYVAPLKQT